MLDYLSTLPAFLGSWLSGIALAVVFVLVYIGLTPHREIALVRAGNLCASLCLCGALLGFVLPVASAIAHSVNLLDQAIWGGVALMTQLIVYLLLRLLIRDLTTQIEADRASVGLLAATVSISAGLINAAAMTY